jgi:hypothetical protein
MQRNSSLGCLFSVICHVSHSPINRWSFIAEDCRKYSSMQLASEGIEFSGVTMSGDYFSTYSYEVYTIATRAK